MISADASFYDLCDVLLQLQDDKNDAQSILSRARSRKLNETTQILSLKHWQQHGAATYLKNILSEKALLLKQTTNTC